MIVHGVVECGLARDESAYDTMHNPHAGTTSPSVPADEQLGGGTQYAQPFGWWGYHWTPPEPRSIVWLLRAGALDAQLAAFLTLAVEARRSLIVVASPHEAGKTTLLTALLDFLPAGTHPVYLRGWYERFAFLDSVPAEQAYVLCNEISGHLPTYMWGDGVRRVFDAAAQGYPLATTMHASNAKDVFEQLAAYPLDVPTRRLGVIDLVVALEVGYINNAVVRRITRVERVAIDEADTDTPCVTVLASREPLRAALDTHPGRLVAALARWYACTDDAAATMLARRERRLEAWSRAGLLTPGEVRAALAADRNQPRDETS